MDVFSLTFLADENFPYDSVKLLRKKGFKVISVLEESSSEKDINILNRAVKEDLVILTFDKDFGELIFKRKAKSPRGIFLFRLWRFLPEDPANILLDVLTDKELRLEEFLKEKFFIVKENNSIRFTKI
jgi:predicted nuclease of predicted toxin-antitoxin system